MPGCPILLPMAQFFFSHSLSLPSKERTSLAGARRWACAAPPSLPMGMGDSAAGIPFLPAGWDKGSLLFFSGSRKKKREESCKMAKTPISIRSHVRFVAPIPRKESRVTHTLRMRQGQQHVRDPAHTHEHTHTRTLRGANRKGCVWPPRLVEEGPLVWRRDGERLPAESRCRWARALAGRPLARLPRRRHSTSYDSCCIPWHNRGRSRSPSRSSTLHIRPFVPSWHFSATQYPISRLSVFPPTPPPKRRTVPAPSIPLLSLSLFFLSLSRGGVRCKWLKKTCSRLGGCFPFCARSTGCF